MYNGYETTSFDCLPIGASRAAEVEGEEEAGRYSDETKGWAAWKVWQWCRGERSNTRVGSGFLFAYLL
jgi:hypothetical protein